MTNKEVISKYVTINLIDSIYRDVLAKDCIIEDSLKMFLPNCTTEELEHLAYYFSIKIGEELMANTPLKLFVS
jgi:hypothetical protein